MPSPKWKLVVDVGLVSSHDSMGEDYEGGSDARELADLISNQMPDDKNSPLAGLLPGFTSLRLLLLKPNRTERENELLDRALSLYRQYKQSGHAEESLASMICRDFMQLSRQDSTHNTTTRNQSASYRYSSNDGSSMLPSQSMNESQPIPSAQHMKQQQVPSQYLMLPSNLVQNYEAEGQGAQSNYAARNGIMAGSSNDMAFSVSPSLHALINSPFSQAIVGNNEIQPLNISNHAGADNNGG